MSYAPAFHNSTFRHSLKALSFLGFGFLAACGGNEDKPTKSTGGTPSLQAEVAIVSANPLQTTYQSSGTLLPNESVQVFPEVAGRVTNISFKEGGYVRKGDLLVQLYDADIKAQIQKLQAQKKLQETTSNRYQELLAINGISRQEYDESTTQLAALDADILYYQTQLRRLQIRAPFNGKIGLRNISVGSVVSPTTLITEIQQIDPIKLDFPLPDQYKDIVAIGSNVTFTVTGLADTLQAKVLASDPSADADTRNVTYRAIAANKAQQLVPGAFAHVYIPLKRTEAAIMIPSQCIIPTNRDKQVAVLRDGKAAIVPVETGVRLVETVEIKSGLKVGDTVLTTGIMQVKPGMEIKISKINTKATSN